MTVNVSKEARINDTENTRVNKSCKRVRRTDGDGHWESAVICAQELNVPVHNVYAVCNGAVKSLRLKTGERIHLCYEENVIKCREMQARAIHNKDAEIARLRAKNEADHADALKWREHQAKLEAERIAEEKRQKRLELMRKKLARQEAQAQKLHEEMDEIRKAIAELEGAE